VEVEIKFESITDSHFSGAQTIIFIESPISCPHEPELVILPCRVSSPGEMEFGTDVIEYVHSSVKFYLRSEQGI